MIGFFAGLQVIVSSVFQFFGRTLIEVRWSLLLPSLHHHESFIATSEVFLNLPIPRLVGSVGSGMLLHFHFGPRYMNLTGIGFRLSSGRSFGRMASAQLCYGRFDILQTCTDGS